MHEKSQGSPPVSGLRRRIVVELKPDELPLLEEAEARHGSKRAGFLAALQALGRVGELESRLAELEQQTASPTSERESAERLAATVKRLERELARAREKTAGSQARAKQSSKAAKDAQADARRVRQLERRLAGLEELIEERDRDAEQLEAAMPSELFCGRCGEWVSEEEWCWRESDEGEIAFHRACGDHGPGLLGASSWLAYRPSPGS